MTSTAPSWARVGMRVVCIDATRRLMSGRIPWLPLTLGAVYTLADTGIDEGDDIVFLVEQRNPSLFGRDCGYLLRRFRPLISRTQKQDTAMFRQLVDELPILERAMLYEEVLNDMLDAR